MNALDQAFIKAFAKDRANPVRPRATRVGSLSPAAPRDVVDSSRTAVGELGEQLRVDLPDPVECIPSAHIMLPNVEHVESYNPDDVGLPCAPAVVVEDRTGPLEGPRTGPSRAFEQDDTMLSQKMPGICEPASGSSGEVWREADAARGHVAVVPGLGRDATGSPKPRAATVHDGGSPVGGRPTSVADAPGRRPETGSPDTQPVAAAVQWQLSLPLVEAALPDLGTRDIGLSACCPGLLAAVGSWSAGWCDTAWSSESAVADWGNGARQTVAIFPAVGMADGTAAVVVPPPRRERSTDSDGAGARKAGTGGSGQSAAGAVTGETASDAARSEAAQFSPAWEVDAFHWPEICARLDDATGSKLRQSGQELNVATQDGLRVLAVTSANRSEGRTTMTLALARNASMAGSRVAVVDADLSNPQLATRLGLESPCDWVTVAQLRQGVAEAAVASLLDRIVLFPATLSEQGLPRGLDESALAWLLGELSPHFDLIVLDMPPVHSWPPAVSDAERRCLVDMAVMVRNVRTTTRENVLTTVAQLRKTGLRAIGIVENLSPPEKAA